LIRAILDDDAEMVEFLAPRSDTLNILSLVFQQSNSREALTIEATPLMLAAQMSRVACVQALLRHLPREQCAVGNYSQGPTALDKAINQGDLECVRLLAPFTDMSAPRHGSQSPPLVKAASMGRLDILEMLFPHCEPNARDPYGRTALHAAAASKQPGALDCVRFLLAQPGVKIAPSEPDTHKHPAAQIVFDAILEDHVEVVRLLAPHFDLDRAGQTNHLLIRWKGTTTALLEAIECDATQCFGFLLPLCHDTLKIRRQNSNGYSENKTPLELALMKSRSGGEQGAIGLAMADAIATRLFSLDMAVETPKVRKDGFDLGDWMTDQEIWSMLPQACAAREAMELRAAMREASPLNAGDAGYPTHGMGHSHPPARL